MTDILFDCDGVIFNILLYWVQKYRKEIGDGYINTVDDQHTWDYISDRVGNDFLKHYLTVECILKAPLFPGMVSIILDLYDTFYIGFASDIPFENVRKAREQRLSQLFGARFHADGKTVPVTFTKDKEKDSGAIILVDDRAQNCNRWAESRADRYAFMPARPYNINENTHERVLRCWDPKDIEDCINYIML